MSPLSSPATIERSFRAMGSSVELLVCIPESQPGDDWATGLLDGATALIESLERRWSRFRPDSELSEMNASGRAEGLSPETFALIADALRGWQLTDALFDPTVYDALLAAGYDRSFHELSLRHPNPDPATAPVDDDTPRAPAPGPVGIELDDRVRAVRLPDGVRLDLGGIGKGRAADLVAEHLVNEGATGACVNLGGDVRIVGQLPGGRPWDIGVEDPFDDSRHLEVLRLAAGAVATSARTRRTWRHNGRPAHHLIDPATGRPAARGVAAVTVVAAEAAWAEVLSKAAFVAGPDRGAELIERCGAAGLLVTDEGERIDTPGLAAFLPDLMEVDR